MTAALLIFPVWTEAKPKKYAEKVKWLTLKEGLETASNEGKPIVVDFAVTKGCPRCEFLVRNVYNNDLIVEKLNTDFIPVWIDLSGNLTPAEKALGEKYDYRNDCLLLFLDPDGNIIQDPEGRNMCFMDRVDPQVFIDYLYYVLKKYR